MPFKIALFSVGIYWPDFHNPVGKHDSDTWCQTPAGHEALYPDTPYTGIQVLLPYNQELSKRVLLNYWMTGYVDIHEYLHYSLRVILGFTQVSRGRTTSMNPAFWGKEKSVDCFGPEGAFWWECPKTSLTKIKPGMKGNPHLPMHFRFFYRTNDAKERSNRFRILNMPARFCSLFRYR